MTAAGRPGGEFVPARTRGGRYLGRLPYGASWDGALAKASLSAFRQVVDDFGDVVTVRRCGPCSRWLVRDEHFSPQKRDERGVVIVWDRLCHECKRALSNERYERIRLDDGERERRSERYRRMMADPEKAAKRRERNRQYAARQRAQNPAKVREQQRKWWQSKVANDPARIADVYSQARLRHRLRRIDQGRDVRPASPIMVKSGGEGSGERRADSASFPGLPVAPFVAMIERLIVKERAKLYELSLMTMKANDGSQGVVCARLGVADRRLNIWREWIERDAAAIGPRLANGRFSRHWGDGASVSFDVADGALSAAGLLWLDVWEPDAICTNGRTVEWVFTTTELLADAA